MGAIGFYNSSVINANGTTSYGGPGSRLFGITINNPGTAWQLAITDGAGGPAIGTMSAAGLGTKFFKCVVTNGIQVVASGTAAGNATVLYT